MKLYPSFSYHEPWWEHYKLMGDYIGRVSMAMSYGQQINQTLVLQPTTSAWMYFSRKVKNPATQEIRNGFKNFVYRMEQQHLEYDLGSENVIKTLGSVNSDKLTVGKRDYSLVVIPAEMENMDSPTLEMLSKYLENGGKLLSFKLNVSRVDGMESDAVKQLATKFPKQWIITEKLDDPIALKMLNHNEFEMNDQTQNGMLYHQRRVLDDGQILFVVNSHKTKSATAEVALHGKYVIKLDLLSGQKFAYPAKTEKGKVSFKVDLGPAGSALFVVTDEKPAKLKEYPVSKTEKLVDSNGSVKVKRESVNILMVNYLDLKTSKSNKKETYFMDALIGLFNENGIEMGNPWQHKIQYKKNYLELDSLFTEDSGFEASYHFQINENLGTDAMKPICAVVERPELWQVSINGQEVTPQSVSYWIDKNFPVFSIGQFLKKGKNTLTLKASRMHILAEVMPVYLLGDFLVTPGEKGYEISGGDISEMGSWKEMGLPFYSQKVAYTQYFSVNRQENSSYRVRLKNWNGSISEVCVNGKSAGVIAWQPYELDVTPLLEDGENEIVVKITGSLKNTFGFFYHNNDNWIHGPHSWNSAPEKIPPASDYFLLDYGMSEPFDLIECEIKQTGK